MAILFSLYHNILDKMRMNKKVITIFLFVGVCVLYCGALDFRIDYLSVERFSALDSRALHGGGG